MVIPSVAEPHRPWIWVALSGVVVLASVGAVGAMVRLATRRQPTRPSRSSWRPGFVVDGPNDPLPGPSERVRELIRLNPEAAAGVLQRWIGQGGAMPSWSSVSNNRWPRCSWRNWIERPSKR
jgi:hypothetical protein